MVSLDYWVKEINTICDKAYYAQRIALCSIYNEPHKTYERMYWYTKWIGADYRE